MRSRDARRPLPYAFDLLQLDEEDLRSYPLKERKASSLWVHLPLRAWEDGMF